MIEVWALVHFFIVFAVGSLWITIITLVAEKKGSVLGGILGGLPSTSAFSFFFIGINFFGVGFGTLLSYAIVVPLALLSYYLAHRQ